MESEHKQLTSILESESSESPQLYIEAGKTIEDLLTAGKVPIALWDNVRVTLNGLPIQQMHWSTITLQDTDSVAIFVVPMGDGGKDILRLVAIVVVAAVAIWATGGGASGWLGAAFEAGTFGAAALGAGISIIGTLAINALIPPSMPSLSGAGAAPGASYFISSQSNRLRPYETIPIVYGHHKMIANLASAPDVFSFGNKSIFSALYDWGLGHVTVSNVRAGDTPIEVFNPSVRHLRGVPKAIDDEKPENGLHPIQLSLLNFPVKTADVNVGMDSKGDHGEITTAPDSAAAVVELTFPSGIVHFADNGEEGWTNTQFTLEYRKHGIDPATNQPYLYQPVPKDSMGFTAYPLSFCPNRYVDIEGGVPGGNPTPALQGVVITMKKLCLGRQDKFFTAEFQFQHPVWWDSGPQPPHEGYASSPTPQYHWGAFRLWDARQNKPAYEINYRVRKNPSNPLGYPVDADGIMDMGGNRYAVEYEWWGLLMPMFAQLKPYILPRDFYADREKKFRFTGSRHSSQDTAYWDVRYDNPPCDGGQPTSQPETTIPPGTPSTPPGESPYPPGEDPGIADVPPPVEDVPKDVFDQTPGQETFVEIVEKRVSMNPERWEKLAGLNFRVMWRGESITVREADLPSWTGRLMARTGYAQMPTFMMSRGRYALAFVPDQSRVVDN